jgi:hypothetical protein
MPVGPSKESPTVGPADEFLNGGSVKPGQDLLAEEAYLVHQVRKARHLEVRPRLERERVGEGQERMV